MTFLNIKTQKCLNVEKHVLFVGVFKNYDKKHSTF